MSSADYMISGKCTVLTVPRCRCLLTGYTRCSRYGAERKTLEYHRSRSRKYPLKNRRHQCWPHASVLVRCASPFVPRKRFRFMAQVNVLNLDTLRGP